MLASLAVVSAQTCIVDVGDKFRFDFSSLANKQVSLSQGGLNYVFTFCGTNMCGSEDSSLCQDAGNDPNNLGVWTNDVKWQATSGALVSGEMFGSPTWCPEPRVTNVTFECGEGGPQFLDVTEEAICAYKARIQVPWAVCASAPPCCTPPTYSSTRLQRDGSVSVVQADAKTGNWFDSNYQGKRQSLLCSNDYGRCFTFTPTVCVGAEYRPAPSQCFGVSSDWLFIKEAPLFVDSGLKQSAWASPTEGYVVTMPLGGEGKCVVVSGSNVETSFEFSLTPNTTYWAVPRSCIRNGVVA